MRCHLLLLGALIFFMSSLFLGCDFGFVSAEVVSEKSVLLEFKRSVSDPSGILSSWDGKDSDYCSWYGISCDSNFKVSSLNISGVTGFGGNSQTSSSPYFSRIQFHRFGNGRICSRGGAKLVGGLPSMIGKLTELRVVSLPCNDLRGEIPSELFGLEKLIVLDLEGNSLTGRLPDRFDGLRTLQVWNLALNWIYGEIPFSISKCVDLEVLNLAANRLNGSVPSFLGNFPKLKRLYLSQNRLSGYFPAGFSKSCSSLEYLDLSGNFLAGSIPSWLGKCKHLKELLLFSNKLKGAIPNELGQLQMLEVLDVSRNNLSGVIPVVLRQCLKLSVLVITNLFNPYTYHNSVEHNYFEGSIPEAVASLPKLRIVWAPRANLEGELPSEWGDCENMEMLNLAQNRLRGAIFDVFRQCKKLDYLDLSSNKISGKLDEELHQERLVNVSFDKFTSRIPMKLHTSCRSLRFLNVSNNQISGSIPPSLGSWKSLVVLDWSRNMIEGHIPPEVGLLKHLKYLSLAGNNLTGEIPSSFTWLSSLQVLDLSSNEIYGEIPQGLVHLTKLMALLLNNNKLSGKIPSGLFRPTLSSFNVSFTNLSASSLSKNDSIDLTCVHGKHCFFYSHFVSLAASSEDDVLNVSGNSETNQSAVSESVSATPNNGLNSIEIAAIVSASVVLSVFLALLVLFFYTRKRVPHSRVQVSESREITVFIDIGAPLTFEAIVKATGNFSNANCIGNGGFGATYRAEIHPGTLIAVKKLSVGRCHGIQQFDAEIKILEKLQHPNLVTLIGYHAGDSEMLLIYNYLPGGNLEKFIKDRSAKAVNWKILHKIAFDIAKALAYLHDQCSPRVLHRDVKPSNILLDNDLNAYLSDFGLSRLLGTSESHATTGVAGTFGYVAPEYALTCRLSEKADVYSYGVVLLELISDKKALDPSFSAHVNGFNIVSWARMQLRLGRAKEVFTVGLWDSTPHNDLVSMLHLAITCTDETLSTRPTMKQVLQRLKQIQPFAQ